MYFREDGLIYGIAETIGQPVGSATIRADGFIGMDVVLDILRYAYQSETKHGGK